MKLFLDSADLKDIRRAVDAGLIEGLTTNPSLMAKVAGPDRDPRDLMKEIASVVPGPVSAEVVTTETEAMQKEGRELAKIADNIVVKLPLTEAGLIACRKLRSEGIKVNITLCFSAAQALLAAKAGATYISPFVGRLDDIGQDGMELIREIVQIYGNYDFDTQILVASVRHPIHIVQSAQLGADCATLPLKVLLQLLHHPLTDNGLKNFLADWEKASAANAKK
jgi:transaldolase